MYKTGKEVILLQAGHEIVVKIIHFYLLCDETHQISVAIVDRYKSSEDSNGATLRHPVSNGIIVQPSETNFCFLLRDINGKVMLYPYRLSAKNRKKNRAKTLLLIFVLNISNLLRLE